LTGYMFDLTESYRLAFIVCGAIGFSGLILTWILKPRPNGANMRSI